MFLSVSARALVKKVSLNSSYSLAYNTNMQVDSHNYISFSSPSSNGSIVGHPKYVNGQGSIYNNKVVHVDFNLYRALPNAFTKGIALDDTNFSHNDLYPKSTTNQDAEGMSLKFILDRFASGNYVPVGTSKLSRSDQWMTDDERMRVSVPRDSVERYQQAVESVAKGQAATEELKKLRENPPSDKQD